VQGASDQGRSLERRGGIAVLVLEEFDVDVAWGGVTAGGD